MAQSSRKDREANRDPREVAELKKLGERIRKLRKTKGFRVADVAAKAELSQNHLYDLETGKGGSPNQRTLKRLAKALGVTSTHLLTGNGNGRKNGGAK